MQSSIKKFNCRDQEYEIEKSPKRCHYKKIKLNIKQQLIQRHLENGESISNLSKLYHLSYSTIAHILKTYKEKNVVFESKRSKMLREIEESVKAQNQQESQKPSQEEQKSQTKVEQPQYYPFAPFWPYYCF